MSFIHNTQCSGSTLEKKSNYIFYHAISEYFAMGKALTGHVGTNEKNSYLATKLLYGGNLKLHVSKLLYDIYDDLWEFWWQPYIDTVLLRLMVAS